MSHNRFFNTSDETCKYNQKKNTKFFFYKKTAAA